MSQTRYIQDEVAQAMNSPTRGKKVELIVGHDDYDRGRVRAALTDVGVTIKEELGFDCLLVEAEEDKIEEVVSLDCVTTVEFNETCELL